MNKSFWNMFTAKTRWAHNFEFQRFRMHSSEPRIAMMQKCDCATHETCLTMKARSVESPADNDQLETRSGTAHAVMAYLGVVATAVVYWASAIRVSWGRGGVERACVLVCVCVCEPPHILLFFSLGKASMSPVITGGAFEVSRVLCVYARLFSHLKATPPVCPPAPLLSLGLCVAVGRH